MKLKRKSSSAYDYHVLDYAIYTIYKNLMPYHMIKKKKKKKI